MAQIPRDRSAGHSDRHSRPVREPGFPGFRGDVPIEERIAAAVARFGEAEVVAKAASLIAGNNEGEDFLLLVGGEHARGILEGAPVLYWPELWGTRALLYVWDASATVAVTAALNNQAWRVREMACRVAALRALDVSQELLQLTTDEVARVRAAAARALGSIGAGGTAGSAAALGSSEIETSIRTLLKDPDIDVRRGAQQGLDALRGRGGATSTGSAALDGDTGR